MAAIIDRGCWARFILVTLCCLPMAAQQHVTIRVDAAARETPWRPVFSFFGYDEPNYTYSENGTKLVKELAELSPAPVYLRTHHLLVTGDGTPAMKWGSTNAYTEDAAGKPVYDWKIIDRIFDTYVNAGARPFVELGFMPEALSTHPQPYTRHWPKPDDGKGWSYPPKDYDKWAELVRQLVLHSIQRYGRPAVATWYWEVWNEPDISYWLGTPEEYDKLYDYSAAAVKKALPEARVGGPASTSPSSTKAARFLRQFLAHCAARKTPLDFISYHAKGSPHVIEGHVRMGLDHELRDVDRGMAVMAEFPQYAKLPVIVSEADPEGCAACSARLYPNNQYRNGTLYPAYTAVALANILRIAGRHQANLQGMLTWAFEFDSQPYFDGLRTLATNGVDKPVLNVFRMFGLMQGDRVRAESSAAITADAIMQSGVRGADDVDAIATRVAREISVLVWNYHDDDLPGSAAPVEAAISHIPAEAGKVLVRHYRIDQTHSNAYTAWKEMGSPQSPTPEQYARLEAAGQLQMLGSPEWIDVKGGTLELHFSMPRQSVSLVQVDW